MPTITKYVYKDIKLIINYNKKQKCDKLIYEYIICLSNQLLNIPTTDCSILCKQIKQFKCL